MHLPRLLRRATPLHLCRRSFTSLRLLRPGAVLGWLVVPLVLSAVSAHGASAHVAYAHSSPDPGAVLAMLPRRVDVAVETSLNADSHFTIAVVDPDGLRIDDGVTVRDGADRTRFSTGLAGASAAGRYVVRFQATAASGDDLGHGAFSFYFAAHPTAQQRNFDARLEGALGDNRDQTGASASDLLLAMGSALAAGLACWLVMAVVCLFLCHRGRRHLGLGNGTSSEAAAFGDDQIWR